jgi:hypothetical protein
MTTRRQMKDLLEEFAAGAPSTEVIPVSELTGQIRRGRRIRHTVTGALSLTVAAVVGGLGLVGMQWAGRSAPPGSGADGLVIGGCGERVIGTVRAGAPLEMTAELAPEVPAEGGVRSAGTVTVTNRGPTTVTGTTALHPSLTVAEGGEVVATPAGIRDVGVAVDLAPGASQRFEAMVSLERCARGNESTSTSRLAPGTYQVYAAQRFDLRDVDHPDGFTIVVQGGPWSIRVR